MTGSAPTLEDVARAAGVSTATVSRCLNLPGKVAEDTRRRVEAAIERLGYTPNLAARTMAARRSLAIGAIIPTMENAIFARALQAFQDTLGAAGYTLLVASTGYDPAREAARLRALVARGVDGLLLIGHDRDPALYDLPAARGIPVVAAWSWRAEAPVPSVGFDNRAAMAALVGEATALGHRRFAMIAGIAEGNDRARARIEGARDGLAAAGLDPGALALVEAPYDIDAGAEAFAGLMARDPRPGCVLCGNDVLAAGALLAARRMGLDVPGAVSVTGFDDIELARICAPGLTTVHVPHREMGHHAAQTLLAMVSGAAHPPSLRLPTTIVRRASLGPAPAA